MFFLLLFLPLIWNELFQFLYFMKYVISIFFLYWFGRYISCLPTVSNIWVFSFFNIHLNIYYKWLWQNFRVYQMISGNRGKLMQSLFPPPSFLFLVSLNWIVISKQIYDFWIIFILGILSFMASLVAQGKRSCLPMQELQIRSLSQEDPLEEEMATHSSILDWTIPRQRSLVGYSP